MAKAKPFAEVFPELAASAKRTRGKQRRADEAARQPPPGQGRVEAFKAGGSGWQRRINDALEKRGSARLNASPPRLSWVKDTNASSSASSGFGYFSG